MSITKELLAALAANFSEIFFPAAKKIIFAFEKSKFSKSLTVYSLLLKKILVPTLFDDANKNILSKDIFFLSNTSKVFLPTFPVAPTIAIFMIKVLY